MHSYVLSNGQKHFVSHMFAMLQHWIFGTQFTFKLYRCKPSSLLYNAKNSQPQIIFWTWFLFNLSLYNQALMFNFFQGMSCRKWLIGLIFYILLRGMRGDWDFQISDLVKKTLMEQRFNPCGEFRWSPEGPVCQIHFPHLHVGAPGKVCSDAKERE